MIIQIALGIVLAVIILAFLPQILGIGILLVIAALGIGFLVLVATEPSIQIWLAFMVLLVGVAVVKEKTAKYWKPPLERFENRVRFRLSALIGAAVLGLGGIACLIGSPYYYEDYIVSTVILAVYGVAGIAGAVWVLKKSRKTFGTDTQPQ